MTLRHGIRRRKRYRPYWGREVLEQLPRTIDQTPAALQGRLLGRHGTISPAESIPSSTGLLLPAKGGTTHSPPTVLVRRRNPPKPV